MSVVLLFFFPSIFCIRLVFLVVCNEQTAFKVGKYTLHFDARGKDVSHGTPVEAA